MKETTPDVFYDTSNLNKKQRREVVELAYKLCNGRWRFDKLDCSKSFARQRVEGISFEDSMKYFDNRAVVTIIKRNVAWFGEEPYLEVGFRTMTIPD